MVCRDRMLVARAIALGAVTLLLSGCQQQPAASDVAQPPPEETASAPAPAESAAETMPPEASEETSAEEAPALRFVNPVRGTADVGHLAPKTKVEGDVVVTTIQVKNLSDKAIAGLKVDEFWWDRANNPVTGDTARLRQPLMPGETATLTLRTPKHPRMHRNSYQFSHAYGRVKTTLLRTLE